MVPTCSWFQLAHGSNLLMAVARSWLFLVSWRALIQVFAGHQIAAISCCIKHDLDAAVRQLTPHMFALLGKTVLLLSVVRAFAADELLNKPL